VIRQVDGWDQSSITVLDGRPDTRTDLPTARRITKNKTAIEWFYV
jgi:hypothetical protein